MTHGEIEKTKDVVKRLKAFGLLDSANQVELLMLEALRLRQGLWDVAIACGADTDDNPTPEPFASDVVRFAVSAAADLRECYDEAISEKR
jgi:hypothetical protein